METADEMSRNITLFADSDYGVGITGKLNRVDKNNSYGEDNVVFISIYDRENNSYNRSKIEATLASRAENKELVICEIIKMLKERL